jgi:hypothetical protein
MPLPPIVRGPTSSSYLRIEWDYPVYAREVVEEIAGQTAARAMRKALPREKAFAFIAGADTGSVPLPS